MARVFNDRELHAKADAKVRNLVLAGITNRGNFTFRPAHTKTAGNEDCIQILQAINTITFNDFRIQVLDMHAGGRMDARMTQSLDQRFVRLCQLGVFTDHANRDLMMRIFLRGDEFLPYRKIGGRSI